MTCLLQKEMTRRSEQNLKQQPYNHGFVTHYTHLLALSWANISSIYTNLYSIIRPIKRILVILSKYFRKSDSKFLQFWRFLLVVIESSAIWTIANEPIPLSLPSDSSKPSFSQKRFGTNMYQAYRKQNYEWWLKRREITAARVMQELFRITW